MSLNIQGKIIAEMRPQALNIQPLIGAYALQFGVWIDVKPADSSARTFFVHGAHVYAGLGRDGKKLLGDAWPITPTLVEQKEVPTSQTPGFRLSISPSQLAALEDMRDGGDLEFQLDVFGISDAGDRVDEKLRYPEPRSSWIEQLRQVGARNILLLEVPLPIGEELQETALASELRRAEGHFANGNYRDCIAACRDVIEQVGRRAYDTDGWSGPLLDRLASKRKEMGRDEREAALWATIKHYTHQAHHSVGGGGAPNYTRSEAQFVLTLTAQIIVRSA